jgi:hypothetical protein
MAHEHPHAVYGIIEREFRATNKPVVKIGKTSRPIMQRLSAYPKGSIVVFLMHVQAGMEDVVEALILTGARKMFKPRRDIGAEYFEGDIGEIIALAQKIARPFLPLTMEASQDTGASIVTNTDTEDGSDVDSENSATLDTSDAPIEEVTDAPQTGPEHDETWSVPANLIHPNQPVVDVPMLVNRYVDEHREDLNKAVIRSDILLDRISTYVLGAAPGAKLRLQQMQSILASGWGAKIRPHTFVETGIMPAVHFPRLTPGLEQELSPICTTVWNVPEYRFLKSVVLEAAVTMESKPVHRESVASLFERFKAWLVETSSTARPAYEITRERFGSRISELIAPPPSEDGSSSLPAGSQKMRGISKQKTRSTIDYMFNLQVLLPEMVRTKWVTREDLAHVPAVYFAALFAAQTMGG